MTQGIGASANGGGAANGATAADGSLLLRADANAPPPSVTLLGAAAAAMDFVKVDDSGSMDVLKGVSPSSASSSSCVNGSGNALYHPSAAAGFQPPPGWSNFYYQQLAAASHSSAAFSAAATHAAMCNWPPVQPAHCSNAAFQNYAFSGPNMSKKGRQTYTRQQTAVLEQRFHENRYVNRKQREQLHQDTKLNDRQIKIWRDENSGEQTPLTANPPSKLGVLSTATNAIAADALLQNPGTTQHQFSQHHHHHQSHPSLQQQLSHQQRPTGQTLPHLASDMSPISLHKNLVSLSLNGLNANNDLTEGSSSAGLLASSTILPSVDLAPTSSSTSAAATAAVFAAGLAGGLVQPTVHQHPGLFNTPHMQSHNPTQFGEIAGVIDDDKLKSTQPMAFGMIPSVSNQQSMAAMWTSINTSGNGMMMPAMSSASTPMSSSSGGGGGGASTPFGAAGLSAMLGAEPLAPWLTPHQFAPQGMPSMMQAAAAASTNNALGGMHGGGHYAAYNLYPTNV